MMGSRSVVFIPPMLETASTRLNEVYGSGILPPLPRPTSAAVGSTVPSCAQEGGARGGYHWPPTAAGRFMLRQTDQPAESYPTPRAVGQRSAPLYMSQAVARCLDRDQSKFLPQTISSQSAPKAVNCSFPSAFPRSAEGLAHPFDEPINTTMEEGLGDLRR